MRDWIPVPGTAKARLVSAAIRRFEADGFEAAAVAALAADAEVTTGALYHHFGSKLGLYQVVREEMERRVVDRIAGAVAVAPDGRARIAAALLVAFDAAVHFSVCRILAEPTPANHPDPIADALHPLVPTPPTATVLAAAWRAALLTANENPKAARAALEYVVG
ncbi:TetR/AcrR family transcriptional regulator [Actinokineospora guangxiensis]|uniref:TetR/AcrR family transcriptional regulator n=1 Tax=Actinokineospora guangxiensis TaxID=1490288 RepID=A0ABW0EK25_9PSEU